MKALPSFFVALFLGSSLLAHGAEPAKPDAKPADGKPADVKPGDAGQTVDQIWEQVEIRRKALSDAVEAGKKEDIDRTGKELAEEVKALPDKYVALPALRRKSVHHEAKSAIRLSDDIREAANAGNLDRAKQIQTQLDAALKFLKTEVAKK